MRGAAVLCAGALLALWASACSNNPYERPGHRKVWYTVIGEDPHGLDPVRAGDTLSGGIIAQIYDCLYEYHYLKRPYELVPCLAETMPQVSEDGLVYTIPLKRGVRFHDDPCFPGGKGREVVAEDVVYAIKRLADKNNQPRGWWLLEGKVVGLDAFHEESLEADERAMDYGRPVEGLRAIDSHSLEIRLTEPYPQLKYALGMTYTAPVAREAVEFYGEDFVNHPVGTGAFRLKEWSKRWRLILERNPTYRQDDYPHEGEPGDREAGLLDAAGTRLPIVDEVHYTIVRESQPMWLYFKQGYRDTSGVSKDNFAEAVTTARTLTPGFVRKGVRLIKTSEMDVYYVGFNMKDPVVGANKALRQAMSLAYDTEWRIEHMMNGRAISAQSPIPPGMFGYDPEFRNPYKGPDAEAAARKLTEAGFPGGTGPDGRPLQVSYDIGSADPAARQNALAFAEDMARIGIRVEIITNTWSEFLDKLQNGRTQVFNVGWVLDYPDPENFLQLLYGPNKAPGPNGTSYDNPEFNELFDRMKTMHDGPERYALVRRMVEIVCEDAPWVPSVHALSYILVHQWVRNYKPHGMTGSFLKYVDVDVSLRDRLRLEWNRPGAGEGL